MISLPDVQTYSTPGVEWSEYIHMNDGIAFAIGRTIIAILENYQQKDGSVLIPKVLQKWVGKEKII